MPNNQTYEELVEEYENGNENSRPVTILGLAMTGDPRVLDFVLSLLEKPGFKHHWVVANAIYGLAEDGIVDRKAFLPLLGLLKINHHACQGFAASAIEQMIHHGILDKQALDPLIQVVLTGNEYARDSALSALANMAMNGICPAEILELIIDQLDGKAEWLKPLVASIISVMATRGITSKQAFPGLHRMLRSDNSAQRVEAINAIGSLADAGIVEKQSISLLRGLRGDKRRVKLWNPETSEEVETTMDREAERALQRIKSQTGWDTGPSR